MKKTLLGALLCTTALVHGTAKVTETGTFHQAAVNHAKYVARAIENGTWNPVQTCTQLVAEQNKRVQAEREARLAAKYPPTIKCASQDKNTPEKPAPYPPSRKTVSHDAYESKYSDVQPAFAAASSSSAQPTKTKTHVNYVPYNHTYTDDRGILMYVPQGRNSNTQDIKVLPVHTESLHSIAHYSRTQNRIISIADLAKSQKLELNRATPVGK